jgi:hypothetical protein
LLRKILAGKYLQPIAPLLGNYLDRQAFATLTSTTSQNGPTVFGVHPRQKAMLSFALGFFGFIGESE